MNSQIFKKQVPENILWDLLKKNMRRTKQIFSSVTDIVQTG